MRAIGWVLFAAAGPTMHQRQYRIMIVGPYFIRGWGLTTFRYQTTLCYAPSGAEGLALAQTAARENAGDRMYFNPAYLEVGPDVINGLAAREGVIVSDPWMDRLFDDVLLYRGQPMLDAG